MTQPSAHPCTEALSMLLLAAEPAASLVQQVLAEQFSAEVQTAPDHRSCQEWLERQEVGLLLLEEAFVLEDQAAADALYTTAGNALVLEVNFGTSDPQRVVRQVRAALGRMAVERQRARAAALASVHNDLSASIAGLLLESEFALQKAGPHLAPHLQQVVNLAQAVSQQLRS